jgi:hypothetical protein
MAIRPAANRTVDTTADGQAEVERLDHLLDQLATPGPGLPDDALMCDEINRDHL